VLSFASVHKFVLPRRASLLRAIIHLFIICVTRGASLRAIIRICSSVALLHEGARPSVLSFASVHKFALHEGHVPPCYHSHLFIKLCYEGRPSVLSFICSNLCYTRHVPPCYHSHLFIKFVFYTKASSVLSFASVHQFVFSERTSSVLSFASHQVVFHERDVPPCYHSHLFVVLRRARPSVLSFASVHQVALHEGTSLRAIIRICSSFACYTRASSVLSFTSVHKLCYTKGHVPPCYHSHLFISCV
jgi:hypothetical protein